MRPYYDIHVFCCVNERPEDHPRGSCGARGSISLQSYMKAKAKKMNVVEKIRINRSGCLDRCELGPAMVIFPEGVWYSYSTQTDVDEILERHILKGERVSRLLLKPEQEIFDKS